MTSRAGARSRRSSGRRTAGASRTCPTRWTQQLYLYDFATSSETRLTTGAAGDVTPRLLARRQVARVPARRARAARPRSRLRSRTACSRTRHARPPAVRRRPAARLVAGRPVDRATSRSGAQGVQQRRAWCRPPAARARRSASSPTSSATRSRGAPTARICSSTRGQRTETGQLARVDLMPRTPRFREDQFRDLFERRHANPRAAEPARTAQRPVDTGAGRPPTAGTPGDRRKPTREPRRSRRVRRTSGAACRCCRSALDVRDARRSAPTASGCCSSRRRRGQQNLYVYPLDELATEPAVARQLTSTAGDKRDAAVLAGQQGGLLPRAGPHQHRDVESRESRGRSP